MARRGYCRCNRIVCETCVVTPSGSHLRGHRAILGSARMPYEKWARAFTLYPWPLWRNWVRPTPLKVETLVQVRRRQIRHKPDDYSWKMWHEHKGAT